MSTTTPVTERVPGKPAEPYTEDRSGSAIATAASETPVWPRWQIYALIVASAVLLFIASSLRHHSFRSGSLDLGFFDQLTYLISVGQPPINSIANFHLLSDHAAYTLYLIAPIYLIWANVHVLLIVQAIALASGAYPICRIAQLQGLSHRHALALAVAYLLYPIVLTANLADFHPETISPRRDPLRGAAGDAAIDGWLHRDAALALGGKEIIALTVCAMGVC
jgi:hypothetical protein